MMLVITCAMLWGISSAFAAAFLSVLWLNEQLGITQWLGTACIIVTIIILSRAKIRKSIVESKDTKEIDNIINDL